MINTTDSSKIIKSIIKTLQINKKKIEEVNIEWKNINKEEPKVIFFDREGGHKEKVEYLKIEIYLKYPLKKIK